MIDFGINGIVLRVKSKALGEQSGISVLGKTLTDWVGRAIDAPFKTVDFSRVINVAETLRSLVDRNKPVTVVLYCDTPLVTSRSVSAAVKKLQDDNINALRLPRGFVFKTDYIFETDALFLQSDEPTDGEFKTVCDAESLSDATDVLRRRILRYHAANGVLITDFNNTYIDSDVVIAHGVTVEPYNFLKGKTVIKEGAHIQSGNYIENCIIGERAQINSSRLYRSSVGRDTSVGPFAYLRPDTVVGCACRIGDFVELKNCIIGDGTKVSHLTYIGDAQLGNDCNVGCGVVFANYDGRNKYRSVVGNRVFIGSNANIVAPVAIADRAFIAAGSTVTKGVPKQALAIARARQSVIENWKGNAYAPPIDDAVKDDGLKVVQYGDGIIDGAKTDE